MHVGNHVHGVYYMTKVVILYNHDITTADAGILSRKVTLTLFLTKYHATKTSVLN
jgi:hypothetical protein